MGHFYAQDGTPVYEVPNASKGGMRPTTITDARKLNLYPSVTTIIGILDKPGLTRWKEDKLLRATLENPKKMDQCHISWMKNISWAVAEETGKAAIRGNEIHDALEHFYTVGTVQRSKKGLELSPYVCSVTEIVDKTFGINRDWIAEASFGHEEGFGGKIDLHSKTENGIIIDFKTKSAEDFSKVKAYDEHAMQLVAYRVGLGLPHATCHNVFISNHNPKDIFIHTWKEEELIRAWNMFYYLLQYWRHANKIVGA